MRTIDLCQGWQYKDGLMGFMDSMSASAAKKTVNLPHDYMIETDVTEDAPAIHASGYYDGKVGSYLKFVDISAEWEGEKVYLHADGIMLDASIEINGYQVAKHHYGYTPVWVDLTDYLVYGGQNRLVITANTSMQPNSRWYTGGGIYREIELVHTPKLAVAADGIYAYTKEIAEIDGVQTAFLHTEVMVKNDYAQSHIALVTVTLKKEASGETVVSRTARIQVNGGRKATARVDLIVQNPDLWDAENPNLYTVEASVEDLGVFALSLKPCDNPTKDTASVLFGIRTITADVLRGMQINGKTVKMKGGCIHHDNGMLGAAALYDAEYRKVKKIKESGFNMIRSAHNPPSAALLEACDRLGMYVFDEAFDAWSVAKQHGDYSQFFEADWKNDVEAFMLRDRCHPSIVVWSTGNEIPERGGLANGYQLAMDVAAHARKYDLSRPITNGLCSFWSGLDDFSMKSQLEKNNKVVEDGGSIQNNSESVESTYWEERVEPFANTLDIVGYNYMEDHYACDHELYPERVILGTESFPQQIDVIWSLVKKYPHVIGDCTWTVFDYIGEAGIGKAAFFPEGDPIFAKGGYALMPDPSSVYPWRLANDADYDLNGNLMPQGVYRRIVWGDSCTGVFSYDPQNFGLKELVSPWGWPAVSANWNWPGSEGQGVRVVVYSAAEEVELFINGISQGRRPAGEANRFTATYDVTYAPGTVEAVSYRDGAEISRAVLASTGKPAAIRLTAETMDNHAAGLRANGKDLQYVSIEIIDVDGNLVPDATLFATATAEGSVQLAAFGSANPKTEENYTKGQFTSYRGRLTAILRSSDVAGQGRLTVCAEGLEPQSLIVEVK